MSVHSKAEWRAKPWTTHTATTILANDPSSVLGNRIVAEFAKEEEARIGAAAPELLEALLAAIAGYRMPEAWLGQAAAAISKATGTK